MKNKIVKIAFAALAAVGVMNVVKAEVPAGIVEAVPGTMNYQGYLTDPSTGAKYEDGIYKFEFRIYDAISGGNCLWGGTYSAYVKEGYFNVMLGDRGADELMNMPTAKYSNAELWKAFWGGTEADTTRYLGVTPFQSATGATISSPTEIMPRQRLLSSPFAFRAERAHYAHFAEGSHTNFNVAGSITVGNGATVSRGLTVDAITGGPIEGGNSNLTLHANGKLALVGDSGIVGKGRIYWNIGGSEDRLMKHVTFFYINITNTNETVSFLGQTMYKIESYNIKISDNIPNGGNYIWTVGGFTHGDGCDMLVQRCYINGGNVNFLAYTPKKYKTVNIGLTLIGISGYIVDLLNSVYDAK